MVKCWVPFVAEILFGRAKCIERQESRRSCLLTPWQMQSNSSHHGDLVRELQCGAPPVFNFCLFLAYQAACCGKRVFFFFPYCRRDSQDS